MPSQRRRKGQAWRQPTLVPVPCDGRLGERSANRSAKLALTLCVVALAAGALSAPGRGAGTSTWYWSPAACKAELQDYGVAIETGTLHVAKAYCVGLHNHCWLNAGLRRYKVFDTVMQSYDGVVRCAGDAHTLDTHCGDRGSTTANERGPIQRHVRSCRLDGCHARERGRLLDVHP